MSGSTNVCNNMAKLFSTLIIGVALLGVAPSFAETDESELELPKEEPIGLPGNHVDQRQIDTPEVVLQLKYDKGGLNRIYLAQFRKETKTWAPSVPARVNLCADLCHAGLGGEACGSSCEQMIPVGLKSALNASNQTDAIYGQPRFAVCPSLCENHLGHPLCSCHDSQEHDNVDWSAVCTVFCQDGYVLGGCPACDTSASNDMLFSSNFSRVLSTSEGWAAWCNVQCRQGQGGAACNCDRAPFQ